MVKALTGARLARYEKQERLKVAVFEGDFDEVRRMLRGRHYRLYMTDGVFPFRTDPSSDSDSDSDMPEETHSMLTLAQNNVEIMRLLLEHGADPTLEGDGETPLQLACGSGACAVVRLLLDHGVDPDEKMRVDEWWTPMCAAAAYNEVEVIRILLDHGASTGLVRTTRPGWRYGGTPLGTACAHGHVDAARLLLDNGADIELKDHGRSTPLVSALDNAKPAVVRLLLARGADVERRVEVVDKDDVLARRYQLMAPVTMARTRYSMVLEERPRDVHAAHINAAFDLLFLARCVVAGRREEHAGSARRRVLFDRNLVKVIATFLVVKTTIPESDSESDSSDESDSLSSSSSSSVSSHD